MNETRVSLDYIKENKLTETFFPEYYTFWNNSIDKLGYSGVSIMTKLKPIDYSYGLKCHKHDQEGRVITLEYFDFFLVCVYVPNSCEFIKRIYYSFF